jgi:hypothetical protein
MLSVVIYGVALVYLLALIPAAAICICKGQWLMFFAGWLTFGLVWFIGAGAGESRRRLGIAALGLTAAVLALGVFGVRPAPLMGVDGRSLQASVGSLLLTGGGECRHLADGDWQWECWRWDNQSSGSVPYQVHVNGLGCWHAVETWGDGRTGPGRIAGCLHIEDYI